MKHNKASNIIINPINTIQIIAEAGVNHNGSLEMALQMVDLAAKAGADIIKFQTFRAEKVITKTAPKADYQKAILGTKESQLEMLKKLELDENDHKTLFQHCKNRNIAFLSTPFDLESIDMLNRMGLDIFKIPSGEITNLPYLRKLGSLKKKLIMSTGMANLGEIGDALNILKNSGTSLKNITVLHCNTEYPTPFEDVNLKAMLTIGRAFGVAVGYSDHTLGIEIPIAAAALGAKILEKHFTLDRNLEGPDHKASIEPDELSAMVTAVRNVELALGDGIKRPSPSEAKNKGIVRKSIVAAKDIKKDEPFTTDNITVKRPGTGLSPMVWNTVLRNKAKKDFSKDELIEL